MNNFIYSCGLHILIILIIFYAHFLSNRPAVNIINTSSHINEILDSYLTPDIPTLLPKISPKITPKIKKIEPTTKATPKIANRLANAHVTSKPAGENNDELLTILHAAIEKTQSYPDDAEQTGREGRVSVEFLLNPDGSINQLHILQPSGTVSLDEAALAAVRAAAPFANVNSYLHAPQRFSIDIIFKL